MDSRYTATAIESTAECQLLKHCWRLIIFHIKRPYYYECSTPRRLKTGNAATSRSGVCGVMPKHRARGYSKDGKNYSNGSTQRV
jgi:hypothetical protein